MENPLNTIFILLNNINNNYYRLSLLLIGIYFAYSKLSIFKEEEVVRTTLGDFISGDVVVGAYIDGECSKSLPGKWDGYVVEKVTCDNGTIGE